MMVKDVLKALDISPGSCCWDTIVNSCIRRGDDRQCMALPGQDANGTAVLDVILNHIKTHSQSQRTSKMSSACQTEDAVPSTVVRGDETIPQFRPLPSRVYDDSAEREYIIKMERLAERERQLDDRERVWRWCWRLIVDIETSIG